MKKTIIALIAIMAIAISCNNNAEKETSSDAYSGPPYTIQLVEYVNEKLPDLHSYTHAVYKDKIVMLGGRTNGLHGVTYKFDRSNSNKTVYVIDTKNWAEPTTWNVFSMPASKLMLPNINTAQFIANNAEFFTDDSVLYLVGGLLGANVPTKLKVPNNPQSGVVLDVTAKTEDGKAPSGPITLPYITAVDLPALIKMVTENQTSMPANSMRQVMDSSLAVTGGELSAIDKTVHLVFGWNFSTPPGPPGPGDRYTHQVRTFTYKDDGKALTISPVTVCKSCWDGQPDTSTAGNFRRRDGSMSTMIDPADGSQALLYYSGVFKDGNTNFDSPVWIGKDAAAEQPFVMRSNVYTCQVVPVYSKQNKTSYATLLGGMKNANYNGGPITMPVVLTATNAPLIATDSKNPFDHIPFSNQFSTVVVDGKHNFSQYLLADSFPNTKTAFILPASAVDSVDAVTLPAGSVAYNGAESEMIWTLQSGILPNGVVDYDAFIKANPKGAAVGYLHGGILSALTNIFGTKAAHFSVASNRIFAVKVVPIGK
jgi:hypothetical protein